MYTTRHQTGSKFFVLKSTKLVDGKPLSGKFYNMLWEEGETSEPLSYRDAMRAARLRGLQTVPWNESIAYKKLMEGTPAEPVTADDVKEVQASVFDKLRDNLGVKPKKRRKTSRKK